MKDSRAEYTVFSILLRPLILTDRLAARGESTMGLLYFHHGLLSPSFELASGFGLITKDGSYERGEVEDL